MLTHYIQRITLICSLATLTGVSPVSAALSLNGMKQWFAKSPHETTISQSYIAPEHGTLSIETSAGNIVIQTSPKQEHIHLVAVKRSNKEEQLCELTISEEQSIAQLRIASHFDTKILKHAAIDYTLTIPEQLKIHAYTHNGSITINKTVLPATCITDNGSISIDMTCKPVHLTTTSGAITIQQAFHDVQVQTQQGDVVVKNAHKNVCADVKKGSINVTYAHIPPTSAVNLHTTTGSIELALPTNSNASIKGTTQRGTVTSEHYLTLKEQLTKLDTKAWRRFKKEVNGLLGTGEALVTLSTVSGNVKISQAKQQA
jgi:DUF4097 and DUF4098 domain-containing protein YvlB